jgi:hypothetical protein
MGPLQREPKLRDQLRGLLWGSHHGTTQTKAATPSVAARPAATSLQPAPALQSSILNRGTPNLLQIPSAKKEKEPLAPWAEALKKLELDQQTAVKSLPTSLGTSTVTTIDEIRDSVVKQSELHELKKWTLEISG